MDTDDIAPSSRADDLLALLARQDLDPLSVSDCDVRIAALESEIVRTRVRRDKAARHRASADAIFRS